MSLPLVSAILPTFNRQALIPMALRSFLSQTYENKELIVLDNGNDNTREVIPEVDGISYSKLVKRLNVGQMRNACCELAQGEIILHMDSDDFSAPERMAFQVKQLMGSTSQVTGFSDVLYYSTKDGKTYHYHHDSNRPYASGTSMCYYKSWWEKHRFNEIELGEDSDFSREASSQGRLLSGLCNGLIVARTHGTNSFTPPLGKNVFKECPASELPSAFFDALKASA